jgi:hypothetical protein
VRHDAPLSSSMACVCPRRFRDGICFPSWLRCALWYLFFPLIWLYHSVRIYCCTCVYSYIVTCCARLWLYIGDHCCCCFKSCSCCLRRACCICLPYKDAKHFPPSAGSIGEWKGMTGKQIATKIEWRRANEICKLAEGEHIRLFSGKIEPGDIGQGQLGDCWLMTSLACLAEFPGAIQHVFLTDEYNPRGRYVLQLYDPKKKEWEEVVVDDWVPCEAGTTDPIFAQPRGKELWVALLEKAFAKMSGSYGALSGGHMLYGLQVLTGDHAERWEHGSGGWSALEIKYDPKSESRGNEGFFKFLPSQRWKEALDNDAFFEKMRAWHEAECVLAAGTSGTDEGEATAQQGLVQGHAYSILDLKKVGGIKLLQLRNPWGSFFVSVVGFAVVVPRPRGCTRAALGGDFLVCRCRCQMGLVRVVR